MTPHWYFWMLIVFCAISVGVFILTFVRYRQKRKKTQGVREDLMEREAFKGRGNISGKRQVFTLCRTPYIKNKAKAARPRILESEGSVDETPGGTTINWPVSIQLQKLPAASSDNTDGDDQGKSNRTHKKVLLEKKDAGSRSQSPVGTPTEQKEGGKWKAKMMPKIAS